MLGKQLWTASWPRSSLKTFWGASDGTCKRSHQRCYLRRLRHKCFRQLWRITMSHGKYLPRMKWVFVEMTSKGKVWVTGKGYLLNLNNVSSNCFQGPPEVSLLSAQNPLLFCLLKALLIHNTNGCMSHISQTNWTLLLGKFGLAPFVCESSISLITAKDDV